MDIAFLLFGLVVAHMVASIALAIGRIAQPKTDQLNTRTRTHLSRTGVIFYTVIALFVFLGFVIPHITQKNQFANWLSRPINLFSYVMWCGGSAIAVILALRATHHPLILHRFLNNDANQNPSCSQLTSSTQILESSFANFDQDFRQQFRFGRLAQIIVGFTAAIASTLFFLVASNRPDMLKSVIWGALMLSLSLTCFSCGRTRQFFGSLFGSGLFVFFFYMLYSVVTGTGTWWSAEIRESATKAAALGFFLFGVPGFIYACRARFGIRGRE